MERVNTNPHVTNLILKRNKNFPNSRLPVLIYRNAVNLPEQKNKAADIIQKIFIQNGWSNSWKNGIYDYHHYHSNTHECLGVCLGWAHVILGGPNGKRIKLNQGDVIILPAGISHKCSSKTPEFLCVGAYPDGKDYDIRTGNINEYDKVLSQINKVLIPVKDPVFGDHGFLQSFWK